MKYPIGLDARMIRHTGIGTYIRGLLEGLEQTGLDQHLGLSVFGTAPPEGRKARGRFPFYSRIYSIEEQFEYPFRIRQCRVWHAPHYNVPIFKGSVKLIVTVHDLIHWIYRHEFFRRHQTFYASRMFARAVEIADHIIAVSCKTKDDLIEYFDADPERISVIYEGVDDTFRPAPENAASVRAKFRLPENYFLYVGSLKPHKNVLSMLHLFHRLRSENKIQAGLVLVGKKDRRYPSAYRELSSVKTGNGVVHLTDVTHEDLVALYSGSLALIHPSLYEGFGLTLLEAMACGTAVIAARTASIPEVAGNGGLLVDPCSTREMGDAMVRLEKSSALRDDLVRKGIRQAARFRWEETARQTAALYEKVLGAA